MFRFAAQFLAAAKALRRPKHAAHLAHAPGEPVEHGELGDAEAARETGARQAQHRPERAHAGALAGAPPPAAASAARSSGSGASAPMSCARLQDLECPAGARRRERSERRGRKRQRPPCSPSSPQAAPQRCAQARHPREQPQAAAHFEQQPVGGLETHARCEALRELRELAQLPRATDLRQVHPHPQFRLRFCERQRRRALRSGVARAAVQAPAARASAAPRLRLRPAAPGGSRSLSSAAAPHRVRRAPSGA